MENVNNNGFTLIEMLVTLSIIAALSIAFGVGSANVFNNSKKANYRQMYNELFKNANIYVESTTACDLDATKKCTVRLDALVNAGLVDRDYYSKQNPYKKSGNFVASDTIEITLQSGKKKTKYKGSCKELSNENIESFDNWGEC